MIAYRGVPVPRGRLRTAGLLVVALASLALAGCVDQGASTAGHRIELVTSFVHPDDAREDQRDSWLPEGTPTTSDLHFGVRVDGGKGFDEDGSATPGCPGERAPDCSDYDPREVYRLPAPSEDGTWRVFPFREDGTATLVFPGEVTGLLSMSSATNMYPPEYENQMRDPEACEDPRGDMYAVEVVGGEATATAQYGDEADTVEATGDATVRILWTGRCAEHLARP